MLRFLLCATCVLLCVSVVMAFQRTFTTETKRATEFHRENSIAPQNVKQSFDPATFYKPNCGECHGAAAEKRFNPDSPEGQMIDAIRNGAIAEGSKDMPAFAGKGIDEAKAKVLINYMKSIRE